jgi:ubiquinol-cytochrome c reductase cytochrome b subunit
VVTTLLLTTISNFPTYLIDPENINEANPIKAPVHIQPEWYFLFAYAILRSIPSKLGGIIALVLSILVIFLIRLKPSNKRRKKFSPFKKTTLFLFVFSFFTLTLIGIKPVEPPFVATGKIFSIVYFLAILV